MVWVIEGIYRNDLKGNKNYFELAGGSSYRRSESKIIVNVWSKSKGNRFWSKLARGSSYRELTVIKNIIAQNKAIKYLAIVLHDVTWWKYKKTVSRKGYQWAIAELTVNYKDNTWAGA